MGNHGSNLTARDTALLAFGIGTGLIQYAAYALAEVPPNLWLLGVSVACLLGSTVLSRVLDAVLSFLPEVRFERRDRGSQDDAGK